MKKLILSVITSASSLCLFAQTPTMDFESWTGTGTGVAPSGWVSENVAIIPPIYNNPQSVFNATSPDNHGGTSAMKIVSVAMTTNPAPGKLPDPVGLAATGKVNLSPPSLQFGFGSSSRPVSVSFWYKYAPAGSGDTGGFFIALTSWNTSTNKRDTVANALWTTTAAAASYTQQTVTLNYYSTTLIPDSMALIFSSTNLFNTNFSLCMNCGKPGSTMWVDDITFTGWNGINENLNTEGVTLFPNPANESVNISVNALTDAFEVKAYDATGRIVSTTPLSLSNGTMNSKSSVINTSAFASGLYSYSIVDKSGHALRAGKFSVVR
jgi:hypothetical protein